jgi:hypothetical protein
MTRRSTPEEYDRQGAIVVTYCGRPPILVLAESVSLRDAWSVIPSRWPIRLSEAQEALPFRNAGVTCPEVPAHQPEPSQPYRDVTV